MDNFLVRPKTDYFVEILNGTLDGEQKTRIVFRVYTYYKQLKQMLEDLRRVELLIYDPLLREPTILQTKENAFLELYCELSRSGTYDK